MFLRDLEVFFLGTAMAILLCSVVRYYRHPCLSGYFKILQCAEFKIDRFLGTGTGTCIQVRTTCGTKPLAPLIAQWFQGDFHGHLFLDIMGQVKFISTVGGRNQVIIAQFGFVFNLGLPSGFLAKNDSEG
jgi:hypothetical protein